MQDWFLNSLASSPDSTSQLLFPLVYQVGLSILAGFIVAAVFRATIVSRDRSVALLTTLILLTVLTCIVTLVIGSNVARAFGLVGALSIVRFRTVVEDTRETAFVIVAVVVGMAVGANYFFLALVTVGAVAFVAGIMRWGMPSGRLMGTARVLTVKLPSNYNRAPLDMLLQKYTLTIRLMGVETAKQGAAMELAYLVRLPADPEQMIKLVEELIKLEGVQSVELKENGRGPL